MWRSKRFSTIGELFFAWDDEGRDDGFLDAGSKTGVVRRIVDDVIRPAGLAARAAVASGANRSPCRGWRDECRELELGVWSAVDASPSTDTNASPSCTTSISSASDVGGDTKDVVGFEETDMELASFPSTASAWKTGGDAYVVWPTGASLSLLG